MDGEHARIDAADLAGIGEAAEFVRANDTGTVLARALPGLDAAERESVARHCRFTHAAVLVFPRADTLAEAADALRAHGVAVTGPTPSVVVRDRLATRHGRPAGSLDVGILRSPVPPHAGEVEIFALIVPAGSGLDDLATRERAECNDVHVALEVTAADPVVLAGLRSALTERGGLVADGGGYNGHEDRTVLYFRDESRPASPQRRIELITAGHHPHVLAEHRRGTEPPERRLLRSLTGAWTTQAIAVAAELRLADHLAGGELSTERLAAATATHPDALRRLLRYLATLGVVTLDRGAVGLTATGHLLRTGAEHSMHSLALLYGGPFYTSFGELGRAVRTGQESFRHVFGQHHFDYFAERPELAGLFDRAMAASASMFGRVAEVAELSAARVVVDVAGGNGELLGRLLRAAPHLRGVLLERPHAVAAARATLAAAGCAERCELVVGDFTSGVPEGGDLYVLSRVLHDWDDQLCGTILKRCAEAMPAHAELLIVERLLPENGEPSLAVAWDLHMLCNVGGRERTESHYRDLLAEAGFEQTGRYELPLDVAVLRARRR